ncbi:MAG: type VI secretion system baseplate subunit TssG [Planctomycetaceae bacterium]|nr:type VI secretion system baseplate subunit TssG [Planctomycetaceae bacterium]
MATAGRGSGSALIERLIREPHRFDFFQAVRVLERASQVERETAGATRTSSARDEPTHREEPVLFSSLVSLGFPGSTIAAVERLPGASGDQTQYRIESSFLGLVGAAGILPHHYTQLVVDRVRRNDFALRDFLDLLNHRSLLLFYRAWKKHRMIIAYEESNSGRRLRREDLFTQSLYAAVGLGGNALQPAQRTSGALRGRLRFDDEVLLYFSGHLTHRPRSAAGLCRLLAEYLDVPVHVQQFQGRWLRLQPADCSRMTSGSANNRLGENALSGARVWSGEAAFRIALGPLSLAEFSQLMPRQNRFRQVCDLVRFYVGIEYDFDVQPVLKASEIPSSRLGAQTFLGWNSWLISHPRTRNGTEAVFRPRGVMEPGGTD